MKGRPCRATAEQVMINSVYIRNFRCFGELKRTPLKRFNFIVGKGGAGKTAFLEAIFLAGGGNAEIYFRVRRWRGFGEAIEVTSNREGYQAVFKDLFHNFDDSREALITIDDPEYGGPRTLK